MSEAPRLPEWRHRFVALSGPIVGLAILALSAWVLRHEIRTIHWDQVVLHLRAISTGHLLLALLLTAIGYLVLTGYDTLAFRYAGLAFTYPRIALSSFIAFVFSHNVGLSFFGGGAVRYRMLSSWKVEPDDIARVVAFTVVTFWTGFLFLGGILHTLWPLPLPLPFLNATSSRPVGILLIALAAGYLGLCVSRTRPFFVRGFQITLPGPRLATAQILVSSLDWMLAGAVLWTVLPSTADLPFPLFLGAYLLAQITGLVSHVPAGLGVFESAMVLMLKPWIPADEMLASIVAYRVVYYLLPMVAAAALLIGYELSQRRVLLEQTATWIRGGLAEVVPRIFAITTFLAGAILLVSSATPELPDRFLSLRRALPLPLFEVSKLIGSVIGVGLLVLANALRQRIDAAYVGTLALLVSGALASMFKGLDWEEACVLGAMALLLLPCRRYFYRRSSLISRPMGPTWWICVAVVAVGSLVAMDLAFRHVEYSNALWWRFDQQTQAPRTLRATLAAGVALLTFASLRLLRPAPPVPTLPTPAELDRAAIIAARSPSAAAHLSLLGDKELLFHPDGDAFLMYGVSGRTFVAMGDPIGSEAAQQDLAWRFVDLADRHGARAVFYEVSDQALPIYLDLDLELVKLGEEGRVPLKDFSLDGSARKGLRQTQNRMAREGCEFELLPAHEVPPILDELEAISQSWLAAKVSREKGFSLGFFDRDYLARLPVAVVRKAGHIVAFANVWPSEARVELSIDLMRYDDGAPPGVMEYLFTRLMLFGRAEGYQYFSLGMAPLSGFERHRFAPLWNRVGALLFRHGEHFYNFQGLRSFKDKFDPEWAPRYLAGPGGLETAWVLTRIARLVSGHTVSGHTVSGHTVSGHTQGARAK